MALLVLLAGCAPGHPGAPGSPSTSPTTTASETASPSPTPTTPVPMRLTKELTHGGAEQVLKRIAKLHGNLPALKLDVSETELTITLLTRQQQPLTLRWRDEQIVEVDSDVQYLGQSTFHPTDFALGNIDGMFTTAETLGAKGGDKVLQIVEYRPGEVFMTVTTSPESKTVFFTRDAQPVRNLGFSSVADITQGITDVVAGARSAAQVGFAPDIGYWLDLPPNAGVTERRSRTGALPVFVTRRNEATDRPFFDPAAIDPLVLARGIEKYSPDPAKPCRVEIDSRFAKVAPTVRFDCEGRIHWTDLTGREYTEAELS